MGGAEAAPLRGSSDTFFPRVGSVPRRRAVASMSLLAGAMWLARATRNTDPELSGAIQVDAPAAIDGPGP